MSQCTYYQYGKLMAWSTEPYVLGTALHHKVMQHTWLNLEIILHSCNYSSLRRFWSQCHAPDCTDYIGLGWNKNCLECDRVYMYRLTLMDLLITVTGHYYILCIVQYIYIYTPLTQLILNHALSSKHSSYESWVTHMRAGAREWVNVSNLPNESLLKQPSLHKAQSFVVSIRTCMPRHHYFSLFPYKV